MSYVIAVTIDHTPWDDYGGETWVAVMESNAEARAAEEGLRSLLAELSRDERPETLSWMGPDVAIGYATAKDLLNAVRESLEEAYP